MNNLVNKYYIFPSIDDPTNFLSIFTHTSILVPSINDSIFSRKIKANKISAVLIRKNEKMGFKVRKN